MKEKIDFLKSYCKFDTPFDCYVLLGVARKKDNKNITNSQEVVFREVIKDVDNIEKKYSKIYSKCKNYLTADGKALNFYIYCSASPRDARKGYFTFKKKLMLYEQEMMLGVSHHNELKRLDSHWLSALMSKESRSKNNRKFMLDIDTKEEDRLMGIKLILNHIGIKNIIFRETKSGYHYLLEPFNIQKINELLMNNMLNDVCEAKQDALFFMERIEGY